MSLRKMMRPGTLVMAGLLPLAVSQAHAQTSATALLSTSVMTLPSAPAKENTEKTSDLTGVFTQGESDLLVSQSAMSFSHTGSGIGSGWLVGGALGAAAGLLGLSSGSGSSAAVQLRTPADLPTAIASTGLDSAAAPPAVPGVGVFGNFGPGGSAVTPFGGSNPPAGGIVSQTTTTPEPGSIALLSGLGLVLTAARLRRRKR